MFASPSFPHINILVLFLFDLRLILHFNGTAGRKRCLYYIVDTPSPTGGSTHTHAATNPAKKNIYIYNVTGMQ